MHCAERARKTTCSKGNPPFCGIVRHVALYVLYLSGYKFLFKQDFAYAGLQDQFLGCEICFLPRCQLYENCSLTDFKGLSYLRDNHNIIHRGRCCNHGKLLLVQNCLFHPEGNILLLMSAAVYIYLIILLMQCTSF